MSFLPIGSFGPERKCHQKGMAKSLACRGHLPIHTQPYDADLFSSVDLLIPSISGAAFRWIHKGVQRIAIKSMVFWSNLISATVSPDKLSATKELLWLSCVDSIIVSFYGADISKYDLLKDWPK